MAPVQLAPFSEGKGMPGAAWRPGINNPKCAAFFLVSY